MIIKINNLRVDTIVGAYKFDENLRQEVLVNISYRIDGKKAGAEDKLENTVDYHPLSEKIAGQVGSNKFKLIEHLASFVLEMVMSYDKRILGAEVEVIKPGAMPDRAASTSVIVSSDGMNLSS